MSEHHVILIRHADAHNHDVDGDKGRSLRDQGEAQAEALGHALAPYLVDVGAVLVSPAVRATQTWELIAAAATRAGASLPPAQERPVLYRGDAPEIAELVRFDGCGRVTVLVGHMPTIAETGVLLSQAGVAAPTRMAPATAVILTADQDWHQWHTRVAGRAKVIDLTSNAPQ